MIHRLFFELRYLFQRTPWDTGVSPPELEAFLDQNPPGRALDLGCGTGTNAINMAKLGWQVTGLDFSAQAIRRARRKARAARVAVDFRHADVTDLRALEGEFDFGLDIGCYHSLAETARTRYAHQLAKKIRWRGTLLLYTFLAEGDPASRYPGSEAIRQDFEPDFEIVSIQHGQDRHRRSAWLSMRRRS